MSSLLWLLLPLAAYSGWRAAIRYQQNQHDSDSVDREYYKGLYYLVNEQTDKAIDHFIHMIQVNQDTVELHMSLANLFRRRGELDRAIMLHQNIIARPNLEKEQKDSALLALGQDYFSAGLHDRAERLFEDLRNNGGKQAKLAALKELALLYQIQKEWKRAIDCTEERDRLQGENSSHILINFYCEMAKQLADQNNRPDAQRALKKAAKINARSRRVLATQAELHMINGNPGQAMQVYMQLLEQEPGFIHVIVDKLMRCSQALENSPGDWRDKFSFVTTRYASTLSLSALQQYLPGATLPLSSNVLLKKIQSNPDIHSLNRFLQNSRAENFSEETLAIIREIVSRIAEQKKLYSCETCGFRSNNFFWQCPSCNQWETLRPSE